MQRKIININNLDITLDISGLGVLEEINGMQNCAISINYQIMMLNTELSTEDSQHFYFIGHGRTELAEPNPEHFIPIKELNYELFLPAIKEDILKNDRYMFLIQKFGSNMGLCDPPQVEVLANMKKIDKRKTKGGIQYDQNGYGIIQL